MRNLLLAARLDIAESLRARWFLAYALVFGGVIVGLLVFGLTESRVMGLTGLSRLLVTYIQIAMAVLPVFVLISTVRSIAGDREAGVFEYMLSLPVPLAAWYWGKFLGRFVTVFAPVALALLGAVAWGQAAGLEVPWRHLLYDLALLVALAGCFLGIGFLVSSLARSPDVAQSAAFLLWLALVLLLDIVLLGLMVQKALPAEMVVGIALANPLQVFRTASMLLFDPQLVLLGPAAWVILDTFGESAYIAWALIYPALLGAAAAGIGYAVFRRSDYP